MDGMDPSQDWLEDDTLSEDELRARLAADGWERVEVVESVEELDGQHLDVREGLIIRYGLVPNSFLEQVTTAATPRVSAHTVQTFGERDDAVSVTTTA